MLEISDAEKVFRPWWDSLEDYLLYSLITIGVILIPTAVVTNTPFECNLCKQDYCSNDTATFSNTEKDPLDPGFNNWWVKKYCSFNGSVDGFIMYYPYFLLLIALLLYATEQIFVKSINAGDKIDKLYKLLGRLSLIDLEYFLTVDFKLRKISLEVMTMLKH